MPIVKPNFEAAGRTDSTITCGSTTRPPDRTPTFLVAMIKPNAGATPATPGLPSNFPNSELDAFQRTINTGSSTAGVIPTLRFRATSKF